MTDDLTKALPCPFCDGSTFRVKAESASVDREFSVVIVCTGCEGAGPKAPWVYNARAPAVAEAIRLWNARKPPRPIQEDRATYLRANIATMRGFMEQPEAEDPIGHMQWSGRIAEFEAELAGLRQDEVRTLLHEIATSDLFDTASRHGSTTDKTERERLAERLARWGVSAQEAMTEYFRRINAGDSRCNAGVMSDRLIQAIDGVVRGGSPS